MAEKRINIKQLEEIYRAQKQMTEQQNTLLNEQLNSLDNVFDRKKRIAIQEEIAANNQRLAFEMQEAYNKASREGFQITKQTEKSFNEKLKSQKALITDQEKVIKNNQRIITTQNKIVSLAKQTWQYLMDSDKVIRETILSLGMSASKAAEMRLSFEQSAAIVARMGGSLRDIQTIMSGFADETGRARILSASMVEDIATIGKGTGLGVENATRLAAQFELMGINAGSALEYVQGVVETSELMGINTIAVLDNITDQFKRLQRFTFRQGVQGFAEMAMYSEKFKVDMSQALDSAETSRNLENAIGLASNLQVLGGEFAKTDPFQLLFLARNDPAEYTRKLNELTKGIVTFRKNTQTGNFETFISPADLDRLSVAEKALGLQTGELTVQARRMAEIQKMRQQILGLGFSKEERNLVEGMAMFNTQTGRFAVQIAGVAKDISELTKDELKILNRQSESLRDRALAAQTFDDAFKATIDEFKTVLLPLLRGVNIVLEKVRPVAISINEWITKMSETQGGWMKIGGILLGAGALWKTALEPLIGGGISRLTSLLTKIPNKMTPRTAGGAITRRATGVRGTAALKGGAGIGLAALGTGAGIGLAAEGISSLADAMSKLDQGKAETLRKIINSLGIFVGISAGLAFGVATLGTTATLAAGGLLAFGGAIALAGVGIGAIAFGVGKMAEGFSTLFKESKNAGTSMLELGTGVGILAASLVGLQFGIGGALVLNKTLKNISKNSDGLKDVGFAFKEINAVLSGSKDDFMIIEKAVQSIANTNFNNLKPLNQLTNLFNKPLKVEFADKNIALVSNITLNVDGYKFQEAISTDSYIVEKTNQIKGGKGSSRNFSNI